MRTKGATTTIKVRAGQILAAAAAMAIPGISLAGVTYSQSSSSVTITHDANSSSGGVDKTVSLQPPSSSSMTSYQMNNTIGTTTQSVAKGSLGSVTNATTATFTLASGTGVTQVDPGHVWGPSSLKFNVTGVWNTGSTSFGPTATGYFSMGYGGTVGSGGNAQVKINLSFLDNNNIALRSAISYTDTISTAGNFGKTFTSSLALTGGTVAANKQVKVIGTIEFLANNGGGPVDVSPFNFECGGAPPTATFVSANGNFNDAANWNGTGPNYIVEAGSVLPSIPNTAGDRARFVNLGGPPIGQRVINVPSTVTLGTLDVDDDDGLLFDPVGGGALNFSTIAGDAVIHTGNSQGSAATDLETPVSLGTSLVVAVDSDSPFAANARGRTPGLPNGYQGVLSFRNEVSGSHAITSIADGTVALLGTSPNTFTGGLHSKAGFVDAAKVGALGTGTATIEDSQLNYNTAGAAAPNTVTQVSNLGVYSLSDITITPNDRASISDLAAIEAIDLTQFNTNAAIGSVNLQLAPGAMISHKQFSPDIASGNPTGIDPNTPLYVFGAPGFVGNGVITVGTDSNSPWRGFGGARGSFLFGDGGQGNLLIAGNAEIESLRGVMRIDSKITPAGPTAPSITIRGGGMVILNPPAGTVFPGPVTVDSGSLAILSDFAPTLITVNPNGSLAGPGVNAPVIFNGGHIAPGDQGGFQDIGTFHFGQAVTFDNLTQWDMDLDTAGIVGGPNDLVTIDGAAIVDGILNVNGLDNFGVGVFTLALFNGAVTYNSLNLGQAPPGYDYEIVCDQSFAGSSKALLLYVTEAVPEPSSISLVALAGVVVGRRARRR